jgi:hypothetical protein
MLKKPIVLFIILFLYYHHALSWPIPDTGQTKCYDYDQHASSPSKEIPCPKPGKDFYGQDGNFIINEPSYTKLDETGTPLPDDASAWTMIKDNVTGLIWENKSDDGSIHDKNNKYAWQEAQDVFIRELNENRFGGATDWRLPTIEELASSTSLNTYSPAIDSNWFSNHMPSFYWSSTSNVSFDDYGLGIHFNEGYDNQYKKTSPYYVRAVRGGQTRPFDHLVINHDGTITDRSTGLMWQTETKCYTSTWKEALSYCDQLTLAGFSDWRLPSREELRSIVDYFKYGASIFDDFNDKAYGFYWSSTSVANDTDFAWGIRFNGGFDNRYNKYLKYSVRGVRGGQNILSGHLVIFSPGQGDHFVFGEKLSIIWNTANLGGNVCLYLSTNGGESFSIIENQTENDGKYDWIVPEISSVNCVLKIEPVHQPYKFTSQGFFSIYPLSPIIQGHVNDILTNEILSEVTISINGQTARTNSEGYYGIAISQPGTYTIVYSKNGYVTQKIKNIYLKSGENSLDIDMTQPGSIAGIISDVEDIVISGVQVSIDGQTVKTNSQGKYNIENLVPGNISIIFSHPLYTSVTIDNIEIRPLTCTTFNYNLSKPILLNIATINLPDAEIDDYYEKRILANGEMPFIFTMVSGNLPPGLSLNMHTGTISGTLQSSGTYTFNIAVSDATNSFAEREFTIDVIDHLTILTQSLPRGTINTDYSENILATGGTPPYTFTLASGSLPSIVLSKTGEIKGIPTRSGIFKATIQVTDSNHRKKNQPVTIQIVDSLKIHTNRLNDGIINTQYNQQLSASGGYGDYTWQIYSGTLPETLCIDNKAQQLIGKPDQSIYKTIILCVTDSDGRIACKDFVLRITPQLKILTTMLPNAQKNEQYFETVPIQGGIGPFTYECEGLPPDLTIDSNTGIISGKSIIVGYNNIEIQVIDSTWPTNQKEILKTGIRTTSMLTILTDALLPCARKGKAASIDPLRVSGVSSIHQWSCVKGYLPTGIQLDKTNGSLSGTPISSGTWLFTLQVADDQNQIAEKEFFWHITDTLRIVTPKIPNAAENINYNYALEASGGIPPYEWHLKTGNLPMGLLINKIGIINGKPQSRQSLSFSIEVKDSDIPAQKTENTFDIEVLPNRLYIYTPYIPNAYTSQAYSTTIKAVLGKPPYIWKHAGQLPPELTLHKFSDAVKLEGIPSMPGHYQFSIFVQDSSAPYTEVSKTFDMTIYESLAIQTTHLKSALTDNIYSDIINVSGGTEPYNWRIIEGTLPQGLTINASTGEISGRTQNAINSEFLVQVEDSNLPPQRIEIKLIIYVGNELTIVTEVIHQAKQYELFSETLQGVGGIQPYQWHLISGNLPKCVNLNPTTGRIYGRPESHGTYEISIQLKDQSTPMTPVGYSYNFIVAPNNDTWIDGDFNMDSKLDLQDVILSIQIMVDMKISSGGWIDINQDCQLGFQEIIGLMKKIAL